MKKIALTIFSFVAFSFLLASCHYGENEAKETIKRNEQYKSEKLEYSINRADADSPKAEVAATPAIADTTAKK